MIPTSLGLLIALILCPPIRSLLFPALPQTPPPDNSNNSTSDAPADEQPESHDSLTGAPEKHKGETAEQEAKVLLDSFATMAVQGAAGKFGYPLEEETTESSPAPQDVPLIEGPAETSDDKAAEEKTKKPMKKKISHGTDQAMRVISDITDVYERFAK